MLTRDHVNTENLVGCLLEGVGGVVQHFGEPEVVDLARSQPADDGVGHRLGGGVGRTNKRRTEELRRRRTEELNRYFRYMYFKL